MFNPVKFNPDEWVQLAKDAGMKYLVFTTRHHDGFTNFDSKLTDYKVTSEKSPYRKDIVRMLSDACRRGGIDWGAYYSQPDWHQSGLSQRRSPREVHPVYARPGPRTTDQLRSDADVVLRRARRQGSGLGRARLVRMMRQLQPDLVINNRAGIPADYDTPEQRIGTFQDKRPWETCATVGTQWAYKPEDKLRPIEECLRGLICCAIGDGNFLFNVGPRPDGLIEASHASRLREMGAFMKHYGESIYGTRGGPFIAPDGTKRPGDAQGFVLAEGNWWGGSTHKDNIIYLHILRWPSETIALPAISRRITRHTVLTGGDAQLKQSASGIEVSVPPDRRHAIDTIVKLELDGPGANRVLG